MPQETLSGIMSPLRFLFHRDIKVNKTQASTLFAQLLDRSALLREPDINGSGFCNIMTLMASECVFDISMCFKFFYTFLPILKCTISKCTSSNCGTVNLRNGHQVLFLFKLLQCILCSEHCQFLCGMQAISKLSPRNFGN